MTNQDKTVRHDAAVLWARGESRKAITSLIERINETNGHCDAKIWLCILDLYCIENQQAAYEKLAVFFSNRFHFSPPSWEKKTGEHSKKSAGQWRNALVIEGSPLDIRDEKIRDFLRASKEQGESRIDFSRMRLDISEVVMDMEIKKLLEIMQRLRRIKCPTLLMGETEMMDRLGAVLRGAEKEMESYVPPDGPFDIQNTPGGMAWMMLFEILQWRGREREFNTMAMEFAARYNFCPIGYDPQMAIALPPTSQADEKETDFGLALSDTILDVGPLIEYIGNQWEDNIGVDIDFSQVKRLSYEAAVELATFLQANDAPGSGVKNPPISLREVNEIVGSLLEVSGVSAYCFVQSKYAKLRDLLEV